MIGRLIKEWDRLDEPDQIETIRLVTQESRLADVYNYVDYRQNQTVIANPVTGDEARYPPGSSWQPYIEPPTEDADKVWAAIRQTGEMVAAAEARMPQSLPPSPRVPPGTRRVVGSRGAAESSGGRASGGRELRTDRSR